MSSTERTQVCEYASTSGSGTERDQNTYTPAHQSTSTVQSLDEALLMAGVFALSRKARRGVAESLAEAGIPVAAIEQLRQWIEHGEKDAGQARRYLAGLLSDPEATADAVADLERRRERAPRQGQPSTPPWHDIEQAPAKERQVWEHDRQCRVAWCRYNGDGRSVQEIAAELGVKTGTVTAMLDRGRVLSAPPDWFTKGKPADRKAETPEQRVERFRKTMAERRMQGAR